MLRGIYELYFTILCLVLQELLLEPQLHRSEGSGWSLSVDGQMILTDIGTFKIAWFATFWLLSIEYTKGVANTCAFIEFGLLKMSGRMPAIVKSTRWQTVCCVDDDILYIMFRLTLKFHCVYVYRVFLHFYVKEENLNILWKVSVVIPISYLYFFIIQLS